ncbi:MAG: HK97 family phage prohead protease [Methanobrevibacter sp.]|nr:HK97 family phage prohead protease [Methanobrevibacter sp.]
MLEKRSFEFEVRALETETGEKIITGKPIVYNSRTNLGDFDEIIEAGALDATDLTDVRFLVNHNTDMIPLARSRRNNGNSTMKLSIDEGGLNIDFIKLDTENNSDARSLYSAVSRGDITGMSFMFFVDDNGQMWENMNTDHPTRHIFNILRVLEVSAVTFPAYEATEIYARSSAAALESAKTVLENARANYRASLESDTKNSELELLKEKTKILTGGI